MVVYVVVQLVNSGVVVAESGVAVAESGAVVAESGVVVAESGAVVAAQAVVVAESGVAVAVWVVVVTGVVVMYLVRLIVFGLLFVGLVVFVAAVYCLEMVVAVLVDFDLSAVDKVYAVIPVAGVIVVRAVELVFEVFFSVVPVLFVVAVVAAVAAATVADDVVIVAAIVAAAVVVVEAVDFPFAAVQLPVVGGGVFEVDVRVKLHSKPLWRTYC